MFFSPGFKTYLLVFVLVAAMTGTARCQTPPSVPDSFKNDLGSLLKNLKNLNGVSEDLVDSLMLKVINLYGLLVKYHDDNNAVTKAELTLKVLQIIDLVDKIKNSLVVPTNTIKGSKNLVIGEDNLVAGTQNAVKGDCNTLAGSKNVAVGEDNTLACENSKVAGDGNFVVGRNTNLRGEDSIVFSSGKNLQQNKKLIVDSYSIDIDKQAGNK